jgi:O-antigen ligase
VGEFESGVPQTRQNIWPRAWAKIPERLWLGHGPFLQTESVIEKYGRSVDSDQLVMPYAHNLYLHLLLTLGLFGTACMLFLLFRTTWRIHRGSVTGSFEDQYEKGFVTLGLLVVLGFFVDQLKIEFVRHATIDYVHFVFALFGIFLGRADRARSRIFAADTVMSRSIDTDVDSGLATASKVYSPIVRAQGRMRGRSTSFP